MGKLEEQEWWPRFEAKIEYEPNSGCWLWTACLDRYGYPRLQVKRYPHLATRLVVAAALGRTLQTEEQVCHACDTPACVNPAHLWLGSLQQNQADKAAKGRGARNRGASNGTAKLNRGQVARIRERRAAGEPLKAIAADFGVHWGTVSKIALGTRWAN